jgi:hypothetical protein
VLIGQPQLGFSITTPFKYAARGVQSVAKYGYRVAQDSRVQQAAAAAAQAYAPSQYATATMYADRARGIIAPPGAMLPPPGAMMPAPMPAGGDDVDMAPASAGPVQKGNMITIGVIVGVGVLAFLLLRK